jgi:hypothetical protein
MTLLEQGVQLTGNPTSPKFQKNVEVKELAPVPSTASSKLMFYVFWKWKDFAPCTALRALDHHKMIAFH